MNNNDHFTFRCYRKSQKIQFARPESGIFDEKGFGWRDGKLCVSVMCIVSSVILWWRDILGKMADFSIFAVSAKVFLVKKTEFLFSVIFAKNWVSLPMFILHTNEGGTYTEHVQMLYWACADILMRGNPLTGMTDKNHDTNANKRVLHTFRLGYQQEFAKFLKNRKKWRKCRFHVEERSGSVRTQCSSCRLK